MLHNPNQQLEALVATAVAALHRLPDGERAPMLVEMETVVFRRAAESYGLRHGMNFAHQFVNAVGRRVEDEAPTGP